MNHCTTLDVFICTSFSNMYVCADMIKQRKAESWANWHPHNSPLTKPGLEAVIWWDIQGEIISKMRIFKLVYCVICCHGQQLNYPGTYLHIVLELKRKHFGESLSFDSLLLFPHLTSTILMSAVWSMKNQWTQYIF